MMVQGSFSRARRTADRAARGVLWTAAAIVVTLFLVNAQVASAAWESPLQTAPASQAIDGGGYSATAGIDDGNIAIAYLADNQHVVVVVRDKGAGAYSAALPVADVSGPDTLASPALAVGTQGQAVVYWALDTPDTANEAVRCAYRPATSATFSACATNLLGPPGLFSNNWEVGWVRAVGNGNAAAVTFEGPGASNGYNFSRAFGAYGGFAATPATVALSGNIGVFGAGTNNMPQVAINSAGDAIALHTGWPTQTQRSVTVGYRDHLGGGWYVRPSGADIYCCSNFGPGDYRAALDGAGNGYVIIDGGDTGNPGMTGIVFAYAARDHALGGSGGWGAQQQLDPNASATRPRLAVDSAGNATATWVDADLATGNDALYVAYRPAGAGSSFGAPVQFYVASGAGHIGANELFVDPAGNATMAWTSCTAAGCAERTVLATNRAPGGGVFGPTTTLASDGDAKDGLALTGDAQGEVLATWSKGASRTLFASMYTPSPLTTPPSDGDAGARPAITDLKVSPRSFRAARRGGSILASRATGATVRYFNSVTAKTVFKVARRSRGVLSGGRCVAPTRRLARAKPCTRWVRLRAGFKRTDVTGANKFRFSGRIGGRPLAPGRYRLTATPKDAAGTAGSADTASFRIKR